MNMSLNAVQKIYRMFCAFIVIMAAAGYGLCYAGNIWPAYDADIGTLPQDQGWTFYDANEPNSPAVVGGVLHQGLTSEVGIQGWTDDSRIFCFGSDGDRLYLSFRLKVIQSDYTVVNNQWDCGFKVWVYDNAGRFACMGISSDGVRLTISSDFSTLSSKSTEFYPIDTTDDFHSYSLSVNYFDYWDEDRVGFAIDGGGKVVNTLYHLGDSDQGNYNVIGFGDLSISGRSETLLDYCSFGVQNSYGLLDDDWLTDIDDLQIFGEQWLRTDCSCPDFCEEADINQDGRVDLQDLSVICEMWLKERLG
jgi:hypothetical protein